MKEELASSISLTNFDYYLPPEKIAQYPLEKRDHAKLQVYRKGIIDHKHFYQLDEQLPEGAMLFFNNTKVINARLFFKTKTGAKVEVFILEPIQPFPINVALQANESCVWECMIRNRRRWKKEEVLVFDIPALSITLKATLLDQEKNHVLFSWEDKSIFFSSIIEAIGKTPLPPYIKRSAEKSDARKYQTIYSSNKGAVAAPTAGLHFTPEVMKKLASKGIQQDFFTLHIGAGTFLPVKKEKVIDHDMHYEELSISRDNLQNILNKTGNIVAVGTTSMRVLETIFWLGMKIQYNPESLSEHPQYDFELQKMEPYEYENQAIISLEKSIENIIQLMDKKEQSILVGKTQLFILPGYKFQVVNALITNYHIPKSTLMLLVAAFIGEDWRKVYQEALDKDYRFLSYGDSSLLIP